MKKEKKRVKGRKQGSKEWKCDRCGKCCKFIIIPVQTPIDIETEAYLEAHGIIYDVSLTSDSYKGKIIVPAVCKYLKSGDLRGAKGEYYCSIHNAKFTNCRLGGKEECEEAQKAWSLLHPKS